MQIAHQKLHDIAVAGIARCLVVQVIDLAFQRFAQCAQAAGGVERLVFHAIERELLEFFERRNFDAHAVADGFARVAIFVDQAIGRPGEIVFQRIVRKHRQRADAHLHVAQLVEFLCKIVSHDGNESRRQSALRNEGSVGAFGETS